MEHDALAGETVLVVEDHGLVSLDISDSLTQHGARVVAAANLDDALQAIEDHELSMAIVDIRLGKESAEPVCDRLHDLGVPFVIHTGYDDPNAFLRWTYVPILSKPVPREVLIETVIATLHSVGSAPENSASP
jgi:DNA-binding NtrC family response regulator